MRRNALNLRAPRAAAAVLAALLGLYAVPPLSAQPASAVMATPVPIADHVRDAALRFGIPEHWIYAVIRAESGGRIDATSPVGAMSLMQIMPNTWTYLRARYGLGDNPYDPRDNIMAGTAYIREMYQKFGAPGFLGAYNAGPVRYSDYVNSGRPLPAETRAYIAKIAPAITGNSQQTVTAPADLAARPAPTDWTHSAIFAVQLERTPRDVNYTESKTSEQERNTLPTTNLAVQNGLFVALSGQNLR